MASAFLHWKFACALSVALPPVPREGIGSLAKGEKQILGRAIPRCSISLEIVSLLSRLHDDDALCFARHAGHVPDVPPAAMAFQPNEALGDHGVFRDRGNHWRARRRASLRSIG